MLAYSLLGLAIAVLTGLVNSSQRRLLVAASISLIIAFFAFPFSQAVGALTRHTLNPTPLGLSLAFPLFLVILFSGVLVLAFYRQNQKLLGVLGILAGLAVLVVSLFWQRQGADIVSLEPLYGLMEALTGLLIFALIAGLGWSNKNLRWPLLIIGAILGIGSFWWLNSAAGHAVLPEAEGYYKLLKPTPAGTADEIIQSFNDGLEDLNKQRQGLGLAPLEPLTNLKNLDRLPREAAETEDGLGLRLLQPSSRGYGTPLIFLMAGMLIGSGAMLLGNKPLKAPSDFSSGLMLALVVAALIPAFAATEFDLRKLIDGWPFLQDFLDRAWPPDPGSIKEVAQQMLITIEIALVGTFLAALFAIPLSFLAARNLTQGNPFMRTVFALTRSFFNIDRGVDTLILALVFVAAVGLGPFAGVLAMAIHSIADLGKVYSESIENVDKGPIEALEAVGASGSNVVRWAILPQVAPLFVGWTLYRFEINFRVSIVIGLVGAGGIGFFIREKMGTGAYDEMVVAIIAIVIVVNIIDFASSWLRSRLV
ncbi:MAG: phosphonate ABC transporter, permease protein PhnE [Trueperaceae bacterium]|nr:phosphonate ABC transporter, permease protein PhnE [Trueperaceae bacterium]